MAQFVPFDENVEVLGRVVLSITRSIDSIFEEQMKEILQMHGIKDINPDQWYPLKNLLNALKYISDEIGPNTLFAIGKGIPNTAKFPEEIKDLEHALNIIDVAYHMNHRGGDIGYYKVVEFDWDSRQAVMECKNPYPHYFDKGLIISMARKYAPEDANYVEIYLDDSRPSRLDGADSDWFIIKW